MQHYLPSYHLQTEGQVPCIEGCQSETEQGTSHRFLALLGTVCRTLWRTPLGPDDPEQTTQSPGPSGHGCFSHQACLSSNESRFCQRKLVRRVKVRRRRGEGCADCRPNRVTPVGGVNMMVWDSISITGKTRLVFIGGNLYAERYGDMRFCNQRRSHFSTVWDRTPSSQDDNARLHRAGFIGRYLHNLQFVKIENCPYLNLIEHLWEQLGRAVHAVVTNTTTLVSGV